jgi:hypothetical protein
MRQNLRKDLSEAFLATTPSPLASPTLSRSKDRSCGAMPNRHDIAWLLSKSACNVRAAIR